jgi:hypothetical protein
VSRLVIKKIDRLDVDRLQAVARSTFSGTFASANTREDMAAYLDEDLSTEKLTAELENGDPNSTSPCSRVRW